jgi:hypothetical protein
MFGCEPASPVLFDAAPQVRGDEVVGVQNFVEFQQGVLALVRDNLLEVQRAVALYQNRKQKSTVFEVGSTVWLNSVNLSSVHFARAERKFRNPFVGPFVIEDRPSEFTYRLKLTGKFKRLHPIFHVVMLKAVTEAGQDEFPGREIFSTTDRELGLSDKERVGTAASSSEREAPEVNVDGDGLFELDRVLERKLLNPRAKRVKWKYKVSWKGYGPEDDTWITRDHLVGEEAFTLVRDFDEAEDRKLVSGIS